jgi:hypothetical protein
MPTNISSPRSTFQDHWPLVSGGTFFVGSVIAANLAFKKTEAVLFYAAVLCFGLGISHYLKPQLTTFGQSTSGRTALNVLHAMALVIAAAFGAYIVAESTGLPSRDFPFAVSFLAVLLYPLAVVFLLSPLAIVGFAAIVWTLSLRSTLAGKYSVLRWGVAFGLFAIPAFLGQTLIVWYQNQERIKSTARYFVYRLDYQHASKYPGVSPNEFVVIHENGILSSATLSLQTNEVQIAVRKLE